MSEYSAILLQSAPLNGPKGAQELARAAIARASDLTGVDFGHLVRTASAESGLDAKASNAKSSATGLFQFIESTWIDLVRRHGPALGLDQLASKITQAKNGLQINDPKARRQILELRKDPQIASALAGIFTRENAEYLERKLGAPPSKGALYAAHLLGPAGAEKLFIRLRDHPNGSAANLLPEAARNNRPLFYENGRALSVQNFVAKLEARFGQDDANFAPGNVAGTLQLAKTDLPHHLEPGFRGRSFVDNAPDAGFANTVIAGPGAIFGDDNPLWIGDSADALTTSSLALLILQEPDGAGDPGSRNGNARSNGYQLADWPRADARPGDLDWVAGAQWPSDDRG